MASPVIAAVGTAAFSTTSPAAIPVPSGVVSGSKIVVVVSFGWQTNTTPTSAAITPPTGFTFKYGQNFTDTSDGAVVYQGWYEKTATASDTGTYSFTAASVGGVAALLAAGQAFRVTGGADPILGDTLHASPTAMTTSSAAFTTFTPAQNNCTLVAGIVSLGKAGTVTVPSGWTNDGSVSGSSYGCILDAHEAVTTAAATGTLTFNTASGDYTGGTIATLLSAGTDATVTLTSTSDVAVAGLVPAVSAGTDGTVSPPAPGVSVAALTPAPTADASVAAALATVTEAAPVPTVTGGGPDFPTLPGETSRTTGTTSGSTAYTKIVGSLSNATSGSADGYVGYFPTAITSNIKLFVWNHPYQSPYDADIAGTGDSGWTFALTSWLLDNGIAIVSSNDAGDRFGDVAVMTAIDNLYGAVNTTCSVSRLIMYGESMGGAAALNWTARHNTAPLVGCMVISGVCDTSLFSSYFTYSSSYNPMLTAASSWAGLPIYMESSPSDTTVDETSNAHAFQTHVSGQAVMTAVEGTGGHLTSGNYPVSGMESWISGLMSAVDASVSAAVATSAESAPAPSVNADASVTAPVPNVAALALAPSPTADGSVTPPVADCAAVALAPSISGDAAVTAPVADCATNAPTPTVSGTGSSSVTADVGLVAVAAQAPSITADATVAADVAVLTLSAAVPDVTGGGVDTVNAPLATVSLAALAALVTADAAIAAPLATVTATARVPSVGQQVPDTYIITGIRETTRTVVVTDTSRKVTVREVTP